RVKKLKRRSKSRTHKLKRLYKVSLTARVESLGDEQSLGDDASKKGRRIDDIDADKDVTLVSVLDDANIEMFDAGKYLGAERLQAEEQQEFIDEEKATLFMQFLEKRRKFFAAKRAEKKRNKPLTHAQQRKIICTYLKNIEGKKLKDLKNKSFDSIQKMFDRAFKRVNTFVEFRVELVEGSSKRAGEELTQKSAKKQKVDDDKETSELKELMEIIPDKEEVAIDAIPLAVKEDLEDLYKLVKAKYGSTSPVEDLNLLLWGDLKMTFEPYVEDDRRIVGIKSLLDAVGITDVHVLVNTAQLELVLLVYFSEKYAK
nr:hypothetical protein [Tanacetum cinerariifolium]